MSKRLNILTAIKDKLETLSGFDVVLYGQTVDFEYGESAIAFLPLFHDYTAVNQQYKNELEIEIKALKFTDNLLEDGEALLSDLETLVRDENWNQNAYKTFLVKSVVTFQEKGKKALLVELNFKVEYLN